MDMTKWEKHTLLADEAERRGELMTAVAHYQVACHAVSANDI